VLFEAGWGSSHVKLCNDAPRHLDASQQSAMISGSRQTEPPRDRRHCRTDLPFDNPLGGGFQHHQIGTLANLRASVSYVTGAHNMKIGYQGGFQ